MSNFPSRLPRALPFVVIAMALAACGPKGPPGGHGGMPRYGLMHLLACFTLLDGEPQMVNTVLDGFLSVKREEILAAAKRYLSKEKRAIVFRLPVAAGVKEAA